MSLPVSAGLSVSDTGRDTRGLSTGKVTNKHQTKVWRGRNSWNCDLAKLWKRNSPGTCDSPNKLFSHRHDPLLSSAASAALSPPRPSASRTSARAQEHGCRVGAGAHERVALKNKPSFGQSGFRWLGCSSKASSSLGQLIISMDARRWCSQVWCTSIKRPDSSAHGSRLRSHLSGLKATEARPVVVFGPGSPSRGCWESPRMRRTVLPLMKKEKKIEVQ